MGGVNKLVFYSNPACHYSHRVRMVLAEKGITAEILDIKEGFPSPKLIEVNPYASLPTLVDRDLVLWDSNIIMEYLDERYPYPPLLPAYPVARANSRLLIHRIQKDWCSLVDDITSLQKRKSIYAKERRELRESLIDVSDLFSGNSPFLLEEKSLVECCLLPLLWRLPSFGIDMPASAKPLIDYMESRFESTAFKTSLSSIELKMRR